MRGEIGWAAIVGVVVVWDLTVEDSLTATFHRGLTSKQKRKITVIWTILTLHLFQKLPKRCDPLHLLLGGARQIVPRGKAKNLLTKAQQ